MDFLVSCTVESRQVSSVKPYTSRLYNQTMRLPIREWNSPIRKNAVVFISRKITIIIAFYIQLNLTLLPEKQKNRFYFVSGLGSLQFQKLERFLLHYNRIFQWLSIPVAEIVISVITKLPAFVMFEYFTMYDMNKMSWTFWTVSHSLG